MIEAEQTLEVYFRLVERIAFIEDDYQIEQALAEAFELGRSLVNETVSPDEVVGLHHEALVRLARAYPDTPLDRVARRLTRPLMEMSMAYGLAFREQTAQRIEAAINARLEQSSKLEAVGLLAAGIAHDFNNILGSIVGFAEMTGDELSEDSRGQGNIRQILLACGRARNLVSRMLTFARQDSRQPVRLDMVAQIGEALTLLTASLDASVRIGFENTAGQVWLMADPMQIQQIVMNLCINAADAMNGGGAIDIRLSTAADAGVVPAGHEHSVCLTISDNGSGMSPEVQARVFDPFFTTKAPNGGSGLGLSVVYGIVRELDGIIEISSLSTGPETGTQFRIFLPITPDTQ